jgi:hypothetical protein
MSAELFLFFIFFSLIPSDSTTIGGGSGGDCGGGGNAFEVELSATIVILMKRNSPIIDQGYHGAFCDTF